MTPSSGDSGSTDEARPSGFLPPNWEELSRLLDLLLDTPVTDRAARLIELSSGDPTRQRALEQLLAEAERHTPFLDESVTKRFDELTHDPAPALPEVLAGRYRVGRELGRGGMASVYLARDEKHGRDVAIKVIRQDLSASLGHERFLREIEIAARLRHANIVPLYDSGEASGSLFFVMPYEEGQSLRERLRSGGALPIPDALGVLRDVARALAYAHEHGVVHRDIKPDNVMLSGDAAVVTDFGIAKAVSAALTPAPDGTLTQAGTIIGTPTYMAPEQGTGDVGVDHRADLYSFGCLAYELFTGHPPFQERTSHLLIAAHLMTVPRPITELRADVPQPVADLIARCLAKAPADRPQSARELLPALDGVSAPAAISPTRQRRPLTKRARGSVAAAGLALVAVLAGGYFATTRTASAAPVTLSVLPFRDFVGDSATELFADGLSDEVTSALTRVPGILIKSRIGAQRYRGQPSPDVTEAGAKLKADYIVTAMVRQAGGRWVVSADLERAADASTVWANPLQFGPNEQTAAAESVADSIAAALGRLLPGRVGVAAVRSAHRPNPEAYRLYLLGQGKLARRGLNVSDARDLFRQAIQQDSLYAQAFSGLSMALSLMPWFHHTPSKDVHDEIVAAAHRALALDSTLALPHVALGMAAMQTYDWKSGATELATAVRTEPNNLEARVQYARLLRVSNRYTDALEQLQAARSADPASALVLSHLAWTYFVDGLIDSARVEMRHAVETDPTNLPTRYFAERVYLDPRIHRLAEARAIAEAYPDGYGMAKTGDTLGVRHLLDSLDARPPQWGDETQRAMTYLGLGDTARALSALERASDAKELWLITSDLGDPGYDPIRASARFRRLLERVGVAQFYPPEKPR